MQSDLDQAVRHNVSEYLLGHLRLEDFDDWFAPIALQATALEEAAARELIMNIEHLLGEFAAGYWSEGELQAQLLSNITRFGSEPVASSGFAVRQRTVVIQQPVPHDLERLLPVRYPGLAVTAS